MTYKYYCSIIRCADGDKSSQILEKRKYCKFKAANILKAIKEARVPEAGPPSVQVHNHDYDRILAFNRFVIGWGCKPEDRAARRKQIWSSA
jgi:hypothetical protein